MEVMLERNGSNMEYIVGGRTIRRFYRETWEVVSGGEIELTGTLDQCFQWVARPPTTTTTGQ